MHDDANSGKLKVGSLIFGWVCPKMAGVFFVHETLKSAVFDELS